MKTIASALGDHYAGKGRTIAYAIRIDRNDGESYGETSNGQDATIASFAYSGSNLLKVSNLSTASGLQVDNMELEVTPAALFMTAADIYAGRWNRASYTIIRYNWKAPADGVETLRRGRLGEFRILNGRFVVELRSLKQELQQPIGIVTQKTCRYRLGDENCGVDLTPLTVSSAVTGVTTRQIFEDTERMEPEDHFGEGLITFTSGDNTGLSQKINEFEYGLFTLSLPMPFDIEVGDEYTVTAGCRKRHIEDCRDKYDNIVNFGGEPHLPGVDALTGGSRQANPSPDAPSSAPPPPPAPAPSPSPPPPPAPSGFSTPRVAAFDYTNDVSDTNRDLLARYSIVWMALSRSRMDSGVADDFFESIKAINADCITGLYVKFNEWRDPLTDSHDHYPFWLELNSNSWWALNKPSNAKTQWTTAFGAYEVNVTIAAAQAAKAEFDYDYYLQYVPSADFVMCDNVFPGPRVNADYLLTGTNQAKEGAAVMTAFRAGMAGYWTQLKAQKPGLMIIGNTNHDLNYPEYQGVLEGGVLEGMVGKTWSKDSWDTFDHVLDRYHGAVANSGAPHYVIFEGRITSTTNYKTARYALGIAMLGNGYACITKETPDLSPMWIDEMYFPVGDPTDDIQTEAWSNDVYRRDHENGTVLVNPTAGEKTVDLTGEGYVYGDATDYGSQDTSRNPGGPVTTVNLAAKDAVLLLKAAP